MGESLAYQRNCRRPVCLKQSKVSQGENSSEMKLERGNVVVVRTGSSI